MGVSQKEKNKGIIENDGFLGDGTGGGAEPGDWIKIGIGKKAV